MLRWRLGDTLALNCSSPGSSPPAKLRYYINNMMDDGSHTVMSRLALAIALVSNRVSTIQLY